MENGEWGLAGIVSEVQRGTIMDFFIKRNKMLIKVDQCPGGIKVH